jgi:HK97 family phage portal protein
VSVIGRMLGFDRGVATRTQDPTVERDVEPIEGTNANLWDWEIPAWWTENGMNAAGQMFWPGNGLLADRVWITNRCIQMNSQQIASMPLRFEGPPSATAPAWVAAPDPAFFPNGIADAVFAIVSQLYAWGFTLLVITSRYADGYPRTWTILPSRIVSIRMVEGEKVYSVGGMELDSADVVQIDRNPGCYLHGESAIRSYAQMAWGLLAAGNQSLDVNQGGVPKAVLKSQRKLTDKQAGNLQTQWMSKTQARGGAPPVLPPELDFETLSWNPKDMALLETQEFNALALAAAFGVPAVLLNMAIRWGMTYQNVASLGEMWWRFELRPTAKRVADALTAQMLPAGQWVWFDAEDTFQPFYPLNTADTGPIASEQNDPQAANNVAPASPVQQDGAPTLTSLPGGAAQ